MGFIVKSTVLSGLVWLVAFFSTQALAVAYPEYKTELGAATATLLDIGRSLGRFIAPVLQLAMVVTILLFAAEKLGLLDREKTSSLFSHISTANNIQAFIAIVIVVALAISALGGIGDIATLKDLALVVVGFYFGTKRQQEVSKSDLDVTQ